MNTAEQWRKLMLTIPDSRFFDIVKNYLGKIKTPFHKPDLLTKLTNFLLREEAQERLFASLDSRDARLLTAVLFLGNPEPRMLFSFLSKTADTFSLHHHVMNLEYRLLIITDTTGEAAIIRCNPVLEKRIREEVYDLSVLFPSVPAPRPERSLPWLQDQLIAAFLSFIGKNPECVKTDGTFKKKTENDLKSLFPLLFELTPLGRKINLLLTSLEATGCIENKNGRIGVSWGRVEDYRALDQLDRLCYFWSNVLPEEIGKHPGKVAILKSIIHSLPPDSRFTEDTILHFIRGLLLRNGHIGKSSARFIELCKSLEIIAEQEDGYCRKERLYSQTTPGRGEDAFIIQQNMHVTVKPDIPFSKAVLIARLADLRKYDTVSEYEITKTSFTNFLNSLPPSSRGEQILSVLTGELPKNVELLLREWEEEHKKVELFEGMVLTVGEPLRHLIDHNKKVQCFIQENLAPGVYLFSKKEYPQWREALAHAGIEHVPPVGGGGDFVTEDTREFPPAGLSAETFFRHNPHGNKGRTYESGPAFRRELHEHLAGLALPREAYEELKARIDKGFILFKEQLSPELGNENRVSEAKGIDFLGKVRLIEQAIASGKDILEIIERTPAGDPNKYIMTPVKLDKSSPNLILLGKVLPEGQFIELQVKKLSLVRKLESVLFSP